MKNVTHYNSAKITGRMVGGLTPCANPGKTMLYKATLAVERLSGTFDYIPVVVHEKLAETLPDLRDKTVEITGQISTCNQIVNERSRLIVDLFAFSINVVKDCVHNNDVVLRGVVCREPSFRCTPKGREICDVMLAVNRPNGRSAYVPCVVWGAVARRMRTVHVGEPVEVRGRFQSRSYEKKYEDGTVEIRVAYEVSVSRVVVEVE
jgi:primosomal replication protein N